MEKVRKKAARLVDKLIDAVLAPKKDTWALVLEGGAMRCIYTAGFLDSIYENCVEQFDFIVGVSAGAACGASFAAAQRGRMQNIFLNYSSLFSFSRHQPEPEYEERLCGGWRRPGQHHGLQPPGD